MHLWKYRMTSRYDGSWKYVYIVAHTYEGSKTFLLKTWRKDQWKKLFLEHIEIENGLIISGGSF